MPSVALVDWTPTGPTEGDLDLFSLEEASAAVERTSEGNGYFAEAEEPRIARAQFVDEERNGQHLASRSSVNGATCEDSSSPSHSLPAAAERLHWDIFWEDLDEGELWGRATATRGTQDNLDDQIPSERASATHFDELLLEQVRPGLEGPSLAELWETRELVDTFDDEGTRTIGVQPHWAPLQEGEQALEGFVGRISCQQTHNTVEFDSTSITFTDGLARELEISTYTRTSDDTGGWPGLDAPDELEAGLAR